MERKLAAFIITYGILIRAKEYLANRSLWLDESALALNLVNKSFSELTGILDYSQQAPILFLWLEKLIINIFGSSELTLRMIPFMAGSLFLIFFYILLKQLFKDSKIIILGLALFTLSDPLIYYSSELKQYSVDVLITIILYLWLLKFIKKVELNLKDFFKALLIGVLITWLSHPAIFILAGFLLTRLVYLSFKKNKKAFLITCVIGGFWISSFLVYFKFFLQPYSAEGWVFNFWKNSFAPFALQNPSQLEWFSNAFLNYFEYIFGGFAVIPAVFFILGVYSLYKKNKAILLFLISPVLIALLASGFHLYPFVGRFLLFLSPTVILVVTGGIDIKKTFFGLGMILIGLLFIPMIYNNLKHISTASYKEEARETISYISKNRQPEDIIYVYYGAQPSFRFYAPRFYLSQTQYILGAPRSPKKQTYIEDVNKLKNYKRVWVLFSHIFISGIDEEKFIVSYLDSIGKKLDEFRSTGSSVYLYDLESAKKN